LRHRRCVESNTQSLAQAERKLEQARCILWHPVNLDPEEWMLVATLVGEADLIIQADGQASAELRNLLQEVLCEFREVTNGFTDPVFLRSTRAARRRNKELFTRPG
jgi:hypothetical protein